METEIEIDGNEIEPDTNGKVSRITHRHQMSVETNKLIDRMMTGKVGDVISDAELMEVSGRDCSSSGKGYGNLASAIKFCERRGIVWQRVKGAELIKCSDAKEITERGEKERRRQHRAANRQIRRLKAVNPETAELTAEEKARYWGQVALFGMLASASNTKTERRLIDAGVTAAAAQRAKIDVTKMIEDMTGRDATGQDALEQDKTRRDRTRQDTTGRDLT